MVKSEKSKGTFISEPSPRIEPEFEGTDSDSLIFPEWSDIELNAEKWDNSKPDEKEKEKDKKAQKEKKSPKIASDLESSNEPVIIILPPPPLPFRDPHSFTLPASLQAYKWKRPQVLFPGKNLVIYKEDASLTHSNFNEGNASAFESSFMRAFVASIGILEYLGSTAPWPIEGVSSNYTPNTEGQPWKGWHHVYSACKAGKGQKHNPQVNKLGKYVLRLFWLGAWRRIVVDDFIPVDRDDKILLPGLSAPVAVDVISSEDNLQKISSPVKMEEKPSRIKGRKVKSKIDFHDGPVELWPYLLCKGLLKIANLSWTERREMYDNSILRCLTGWVCQKICTTAYTKHYEFIDPDDAPPSRKKSATVKDKKTETKSEKTEKSKKGGDKGKSIAQSEVTPYCVIVKMSDSRIYSASAIATFGVLSPCWGHIFLVPMISNVPINRKPSTEVLANWKKFRWIEWAASHGVYYANNSQTRFLQLVNFFQDIHEASATNPKSSFYLPFGKSDSHTSDNQMDNKQVGSSAYNVSGPGKKPTKIEVKKTYSKADDGTDAAYAWVDFNIIGNKIESLYIYFKPKLLHSKVTITDVEEKKSTQRKVTKDVKPQKNQVDQKEQKIIWPYHLLQYNNQPLYVFFDTLDPKIMIVSLSNAGNREILEEKCLVVHCDLTSLWQKKFDFNKRHNMRYNAYLLMEKYDWQTDTFGEHVMALWTAGCKTLTLSLDPGRQIFRLWIGSASSYNITILSDVDVQAGNFEQILELMKTESARYLQFCLDFGTGFGELVNAFGTDQYLPFLRNYYWNCIPSGVTKIQVMKFRENITDLLLEMIKKKIPDCGKAFFALRILFMTLDLGWNKCPPSKVKDERKKSKPIVLTVQAEPEWTDNKCLSEDSFSEIFIDSLILEKQREMAATKIQAFFKMIYVQKLKAYHQVTHPRYGEIFDTLKKVYQTCFNVNQRLEEFPSLFRKMIKPEYKQCYSWGVDLSSVVNIQMLLGNLSSKSISSMDENEPQWIFLCRYVFYVDSPYDEPVKIAMFINLDQFILRVVNNDTLEETIRGVNCATVANYSCNSLGYTILAYGWVREKVTINYKINLISLNRSSRYQLIIEDNKHDMPALADIYHHSKSGTITKVLLGISNDMPLSMRFTCSYQGVLMKILCRSSEGKVVQEITGKGNVVLPVLRLKYQKEQQVASKSVSKMESFCSKRSVSTMSSTRKKSSIRNSSADSVASSARTSSTGSKNPMCFYTLEAKILKKSWPLTKEEWKESDKQIEKNYIGGLLSSVSAKTSSRVLLKKLNDIGKPKAIDYDNLPEPKWSVQMVHNSKNPLQLKLDLTHCNEVRMKKLKWYENNSGRFKKAQKARQDYLAHALEDSLEEGFEGILEQTNELYFQDTLAEGSSDNSITRTQVHPDVPTRRGMNYNKYGRTQSDTISYVSYKQDNDETHSRSSSTSSRKNKEASKETAGRQCFELFDELPDYMLKKPEDLEMDAVKREQACEKFEEYRENFLFEMREYRERFLTRSADIYKWFDGIRSDSEELMAYAYTKREHFLRMVGATVEPQDTQRSKEEKKPKVDKPHKKGKK